MSDSKEPLELILVTSSNDPSCCIYLAKWGDFQCFSAFSFQDAFVKLLELDPIRCFRGDVDYLLDEFARSTDGSETK